MIRRLVGVAALAAAAIVAVPAGAQAAPALPACGLGYTCATYFWDSSAHTTIIGAITQECDGSSYTWGERSRYVTFSSTRCS
ncbi:DUF6289 family protein [Sphaerisporangium fuscum]|uniref:DUF6289 family protein n=1 Tax=Sphaerisporangium fuscum TaxID=2835868 RepID=UPI001BDCEA58|nr:DUF6289 family protein [Sphaerisporangium fuscum]